MNLRALVFSLPLVVVAWAILVGAAKVAVLLAVGWLHVFGALAWAALVIAIVAGTVWALLGSSERKVPWGGQR